MKEMKGKTKKTNSQAHKSGSGQEVPDVSLVDGCGCTF